MSDLGSTARGLDRMLPRLGKHPKKVDPRTLQLARYLTPELPAPPPSCDYSVKLSTLGMMANDRVGDCTCAAAGHIVQDATSYEGAQVVVPDADVLAMYSAVSGYDPVTGANDNGAACLDVLNYWHQTGFAGPQGPHKIAAFAELGLVSSAIQTAVYLLGAAYIGVNLPLTCQGASSWEVPPGGTAGNGAPGSWGGHCVPIVAYDATGVTVLTWGEKLHASWEFLATYMDEAYAVVTQDFVDAQGTDPAGLDLTQMLADAAALGTSPVPAPAPALSCWQRFLRRIRRATVGGVRQGMFLAGLLALSLLMLPVVFVLAMGPRTLPQRRTG